MTRDNQWLKLRLENIWQKYFPDINLLNNIIVKFGLPCRTRLGSIKLGKSSFLHKIGLNKKENPNSIITINGHFKDEKIPEFVVDAVLAHEFTHYAHGFCSPLKRQYRHPHKGGIVKNEMIDRGLNELLRLEKKWVKLNWVEFLKTKKK